MDLTAFAGMLEASSLAEWMRGSLKALPIIESIHVMAVALVFGTIFIVDLRLLGFPNTRRPFTRESGELLTWTWMAFVVAVVTGSLMFVPNASRYVVNTAFGLKMATLLAAGLNMAIFQFTTFRTVARWDAGRPVPLAGRIAGGLSIVLWTSVIVFGRWIGFTKGYDFSVPEEIDFDFLDGSLRFLTDLLT